jgi:hypothetical protein
VPSASAPQPAATPATTAAAGAVSGEEVFELAEEQLNAGKTAPGRDHAHSPFCNGKAGRGARNLT